MIFEGGYLGGGGGDLGGGPGPLHPERVQPGSGRVGVPHL
jgi:hypothetical protein